MRPCRHTGTKVTCTQPTHNAVVHLAVVVVMLVMLVVVAIIVAIIVVVVTVIVVVVAMQIKLTLAGQMLVVIFQHGAISNRT